MAHDVFLSYSSKDKPTADAVCNGLESAGIRCWMAPRDILPGQQWASAIVEAIHASRLMVVVLSTNSNVSEQVLREVERSVHRAVPIIPFRIEEFELASALEYYLSTPHWLDAIAGPLEVHIQQLVATAQVLLQSGEHAPSYAEPHRDVPSGSRASADPLALPVPPAGQRPSRVAAHRRTGFIVAGGLILMALVVVSLTHILPLGGRGSVEAGEAALPDESLTGPTASPAQQILSDDFEDPVAGWLPRSFSDTTRGEFAGGYEAGAYVIRTVVPVTDRYWTITAPGVYANAEIGIEARLVGDTAGRTLGLSCRRQGSGNEYRVALNVDRGTFAIFRVLDRRTTTLLPSTPATTMQRGNRSNHLELACVGTTIMVRINGATVGSVDDDMFKEGRFGIQAGTTGTSALKAEARFDNLALNRL